MMDSGQILALDNTSMGECRLCPRDCGANRIKRATGYCGTGAGYSIASICVHQGEEPVIGGTTGICNVFFTACNLRCSFCQNHEISSNAAKYARAAPGKLIRELSLQLILDQIERILDQGIRAVGFVTPSHVVPQVRAIIRALNERGRKPITVWNSNAFEKPEVLRTMEGMIDVYLPDFKYSDSQLASRLSDATGYPEIALAAIKEMYRQKGSMLHTGEDGQAESGLIIRHLVLPGFVENSLGVLRMIAEEISTGVSISLMAQYHPTPHTKSHAQLSRVLYASEYEQVLSEMEILGFRKGFTQSPESASHYLPDFSRNIPFGTK